MPGIRELRDRVKGVKNIQQITRAMKMVASARLHKAQQQLLEARPYAAKLCDMIRQLAGHAPAECHPLLRVCEQAPEAWVVLASDKGLCGGFNAQPLQRVGRVLAEAPAGKLPEVLVLGRKGVDFFRRTGVKPFREWAGFWQDLNWHHANLVGQEMIEAFAAGRWSKVTLVYNRFKSALVQEAVSEQMLPLPPADTQPLGRYREFEFEPDAAEILAALLPRYVKMSLWHALLESKAAEQAARMQAMDNATDNAGEMIGDLTLKMNRARQAMITREIAEVVGSAEAVMA
ncbi:MAG: ATP synthase F1 subunit gamma [candidate division FCPU426 bacterium]